MKIVGFLPARDEEDFLRKVLRSMNSQSTPFDKIIVVNDASVDRTGEIAEEYGAEVINLTFRHPSYLGYPKLAEIYNHALDYINERNIPYDYLVQHGADTILNMDYNEKMLARMEKNNKLVIASGEIIGEPVVKTHARGVGRFVKGWFWKQYVKKFPIIYSWESYPIYKAFSLGLEVTNFPEIKMKGLRSTTSYNRNYGFAMRELGYFPFYALFICMSTTFKDKEIGIKMLKSYIFSPFKMYDKNIKKWLRNYQISQIKTIIKPQNLLLLKNSFR